MPVPGRSPGSAGGLAAGVFTSYPYTLEERTGGKDRRRYNQSSPQAESHSSP